MLGVQQIPPGQRVVVRLGFDSPTDPAGADLLLETGGPPIQLVRSAA